MDVIKLFSGGFPLTVERLRFLQNTYKKAFSDLSNIAGTGNLIIKGVNTSGGNLSDGVVIIGGEIFPFVGGPIADTIRIKETSVNVPYNEDADNDGALDQKAADTVREAVPSDASDPSFTPEEYLLSSFVRVGSLQQIAPIVGAVQMYHGDPLNLPYFWKVCDGQNGTPDLRDKFIAGAGGAYNLGASGGANEVQLTKAQLPNYNITGNTNSAGNHRHEVDTWPAASKGEAKSDAYYRVGYEPVKKYTDYQGAHSHFISLPTGGSDQAHENRPPFFALYYIMFTGF